MSDIWMYALAAMLCVSLLWFTHWVFSGKQPVDLGKLHLRCPNSPDDCDYCAQPVKLWGWRDLRQPLDAGRGTLLHALYVLAHVDRDAVVWEDERFPHALFVLLHDQRLLGRAREALDLVRPVGVRVVWVAQ